MSKARRLVHQCRKNEHGWQAEESSRATVTARPCGRAGIGVHYLVRMLNWHPSLRLKRSSV